jgi:hypothetical protein
LQTFKTMSPKLDPNDVPDPKAFREQINALGEKELEKLRKEFVKHLLNTPNSDCVLYFCSDFILLLFYRIQYFVIDEEALPHHNHRDSRFQNGKMYVFIYLSWSCG